jgi:hypothetical protein
MKHFPQALIGQEQPPAAWQRIFHASLRRSDGTVESGFRLEKRTSAGWAEIAFLAKARWRDFWAG